MLSKKNKVFPFLPPVMSSRYALYCGLALLVGLVCPIAYSWNAQAKLPDIIRIEVGQKERNYTQSDLQYRIWMLERAVAQLQARVFELELGGAAQKTPENQMVTCYIETPFNGTHMATEPTETAAKAKAMQLCSKSGASSIHCEGSDVKCGK